MPTAVLETVPNQNSSTFSKKQIIIMSCNMSSKPAQVGSLRRKFMADSRAHVLVNRGGYVYEMCTIT